MTGKRKLIKRILSILLVCLMVWTTPMTALAADGSRTADKVPVTFTLLGDSVHNSDADGNAHTFLAGNLQTWIPKTTYLMDGDSSVRDLILKALEANGMTYEANRDISYISAITRNGVRLAAFTNGKNSGWMYAINGEYSNLTIAQQKLAAGDAIVFYYTDNYIKEKPHQHDWMSAWSSDSAYHWHECDGSGADCDAVNNSQKNGFAAHTGSWVTTHPVSCTSDGTEKFTCSVCGYNVSRTIQATGHQFGAWEQITPSTVFTEEVYKRVCSVCGYTEEKTVSGKITPVLELPGKINALSIKKGAAVRFSLTIADSDYVTSVVSGNIKYVKVASWQKTGAVSLKGAAKGKTTITVKLASGMSRIYTVNVVSGTIKTTRIAVDSTKITLEKNRKTTLKPVLTPFTSTQKITYKSSNKKVASITAAGKIKAVAPGTAKITITSGNKKAFVTVTVPGISLTKTSVTVKRNKNITLKPKLYGIGESVTYTSSNENVATVTANGKIKGVKKGTATISVKAGAYTLRCKVKVK